MLNRIDIRRVRNAAVGMGGVALTALLAANVLTGEAVEAAAQPAAAAPAVSPATSPAIAPEIRKDLIRNGEVGFVLTQFAYALGPDAKDSGSCPEGMSGGMRALMDAYKKTPAGMEQPGENPQRYEGRLERAVTTAPDGRNLCLHPEAGGPDPNWRTVSGRNLKVEGIDLDGEVSAPGKRPAAGTCAHEDFQGTQGERGVDNQFYRVVGCTAGFQSTGAANGWQTEMYTGSWGVLMSLKGVDDLMNDPAVEVGIYASADPLQLSSDRKALGFATYAIHPDARYHATARGRIVNGVLTMDPVDVRVLNVVAGMYSDRVLRDARLRLTFTPDGGMEGYLAGYTPVDDMFDVQYGARSSRAANGELAPERRRASTSVGRAGALGHTCNGAYFALQQAADGHRDPVTGRCTSISTQYRVRIAPAFIVKTQTKSVNSPLAVQ